jgi:four helix bundle protein
MLNAIKFMEKIKSHHELRVYKISFATAQKIYKLTKKFPSEEKYSLTDQIRRSSRSVAANIAEAFRTRRYPAAFISKLGLSEGEAAETQVWLEFSEACEYISIDTYNELYNEYERIIGMIVNMIRFPDKWKTN